MFLPASQSNGTGDWFCFWKRRYKKSFSIATWKKSQRFIFGRIELTHTIYEYIVLLLNINMNRYEYIYILYIYIHTIHTHHTCCMIVFLSRWLSKSRLVVNRGASHLMWSFCITCDGVFFGWSRRGLENIIQKLIVHGCPLKWLWLPVVPHKAVAEVSKIGNL